MYVTLVVCINIQLHRANLQRNLHIWEMISEKVIALYCIEFTVSVFPLGIKAMTSQLIMQCCFDRATGMKKDKLFGMLSDCVYTLYCRAAMGKAVGNLHQLWASCFFYLSTHM